MESVTKLPERNTVLQFPIPTRPDSKAYNLLCLGHQQKHHSQFTAQISSSPVSGTYVNQPIIWSFFSVVGQLSSPSITRHPPIRICKNSKGIFRICSEVGISAAVIHGTPYCRFGFIGQSHSHRRKVFRLPWFLDYSQQFPHEAMLLWEALFQSWFQSVSVILLRS